MTNPLEIMSRSADLPWLRLRHGIARYMGVLLLSVYLVIWQVATQPQFATRGNVLNILETNSALLVVAIGMTFVMLVGGFDLSVGGLLALSGVLLSKLIHAGVPTLLAILLIVAAAAALGILSNGNLIAVLGLSFFVVTIGTASIFRASALIITKGSTQSLYDNTFLRTFGSGDIWESLGSSSLRSPFCFSPVLSPGTPDTAACSSQWEATLRRRAWQGSR